MKKYIYTILALLFIVSCQKSSDSEKEKFIENLISQMTLAEKAGQMNQYNGFWDAIIQGLWCAKFANIRKAYEAHKVHCQD
mgnify:CR=1 FL=1